MSDRCHAAPYWRMGGHNGSTYHFLEHVGTHALARDLDLLRGAMGEARLSLYGASYGTEAMAVYASIFPEHVDRLVLDGNMHPVLNAVPFGLSLAVTVSQLIHRMLENCRVQPSCALKDPFRSFRDVLDASQRGVLWSPRSIGGTRLSLTSGVVVGYLHSMAGLRGCGWKAALTTLALLADADATRQHIGAARVLDVQCRIGDNITWRLYGACIDEVQVGVDTDAVMGTAVLGLDFAGRFDVESGVRLWRAARLLHGDHSLGLMLGYMSAIGTWRVQPAPVAPFGSARVAPLVLANLYDQATGYQMSQRMAAAFPDSSLLSYQGVGHCLDSPAAPTNIDPVGTGECFDAVQEYLRTGVKPLNGYTCSMQVPIPVPTSLDVDGAARA